MKKMTKAERREAALREAALLIEETAPAYSSDDETDENRKAIVQDLYEIADNLSALATAGRQIRRSKQQQESGC